MKKRITALLLCLTMLLQLVTGSVVANSSGDYSASIGRYAVLSDTGYGVQVGNFTDIATGTDAFLNYEEFEPGTIFRISDWYIDSATSSLWYQVELYRGGVVPESQEYWPDIPWILQNYVDEDSSFDSLTFLDTCDVCGKPDCGGHDSTESTKICLDGVEVTQITIPQYDKPTLSAATTLSGDVSYRWQILADAQSDLWVNISGERNPELTLTYGKVAMLLNSSNQTWVRCITTAEGSETVSDALLVTLEPYAAPSALVETLPELTEETVEATEETTEAAEETTEATEETTEPTEETAEPTVETTEAAEETTEPTVETTEATAETTEATEETFANVFALSQEAMRLLPLEQRVPSSASDIPDGEGGGEADTKTYQVTIQYLFRDGSPAASTDTITVGASGVMQNPIRYPAVQGYLPYIVNAEGKHEHQDEFAARTLTEDIELTVYYLPTTVQYQIVVYQQNVENDNYTKLPDPIVRYAETGSLVPDFTKEQPDGVKLEFEGFYPLLHEMPTVAADGSTLVEMYFDRYYYLMTFNLDGGYGVEPIYARYGMPIEVAKPLRSGYAFAGWTDENGTVVSIPETMPINGGTFHASWKSINTTYKVSYWFINDDGTRSLIGTRVEPGVSEDTVSGKDDLKDSVICGNETNHSHTESCYSCAQHTAACFNVIPNDPQNDGRAVIASIPGGNNPEPGYVYVIKTRSGSMWPKLYFDGNYYAINGIGSGANPATEEQVRNITEGGVLASGTYKELTVEKYKLNIGNTHNDSNRTCQEHTHNKEDCYYDTTYLEYVDTETVTKTDGTEVTYTTDQNVVVKGDGTTIVDVYYRYKQYTLRFYYAATTGGTTTDKDKNPNTYDTIKILGGTSYYFGAWGPNSSNDEDLLENTYWNYSNQWGQIKELPGLNNNGLAKNYTTGSEVFTHNNTAVTYHYISFEARYGDDISGMWPCSVFNSATRTTANTHGNWNGKEAFVSAWNGEHHVRYSQDNANQTIKGIYERLDENLLFHSKYTDERTVSYLCFWENGANISWSVPELYRYNIYLEAYSGQDLTGKTTKTRNGKTYYLSASYDTCDDSDVNGQTQVSLMGYTKAGRTSSKITDFDTALYKEAYDVDFFYDANKYRFSFWNHNDYLTNGTGSMVAYNEPLKKYFEGITVNGTDYDGANDLIAKPEYYPDTLEPDAYEFEGWYTSANFEPETKANPETMTMPDEALMVYAHWVPVVHHVRIFLTEDLAVQNSTTIKYFDIPHGELVPEKHWPEDPVNGDYQFIGWFYRDSEGREQAFDFANMPVKDGMHLYAKWSSNVLKTYTIRYVTKNADGQEIEIAAPTTGSALAGSTKTFEAKGGSALYAGYREGYFPLVKSHSITLNIEQDGTEVYTFEYVRKEAVPYTVHYYKMDLDGKPVYEYVNGNQVNVTVYDSKTVSTKNSEVVENYVSVPGYRPDDFQKKLVISAEDGADNTIIFWYKPNTTHAFLRVNHYLEDIPAAGSGETTWTPSPDYSYSNEVLIVGNAVQHFSESPVAIEGFTYDADHHDQKTNGSLSQIGQELELRLYYKRNQYPYQIQYLEYGTDTVLAEPKNYTGNECAYYGNAITAASEDIKPIDGYAYYSKVGCTIAVEQDPQNPRRNIIKVYYVPVTGNLKITKQIEVINNNAPDPFDQEFTFTVTVPNGTYPVTIGENTEVKTVTDGSIEVRLKDGQSAVIAGLPQGPSTNKQTYTITETPVTGFLSNFSSDCPDSSSDATSITVTVSEGKTTTVTCTNQYPVGTLQIVKTVDKEYDNDIWEKGSFSFQISSDALANGKSYTATIDGVDERCWVSNGAITLTDIEVTSPNTPVTITIPNVPAGNYTVTETQAMTNGATTDDLKTSYFTTANNKEGCTAAVNVTASETPGTAVFLNTFQRTTGDLCVSKTITIVPESGASLDPNAEFTFTVQMPEDIDERFYVDKTYTVTGHDTIQSVAPNENKVFTFVLKHGESLVIEDLPVGSYVITEAPETGYASSFPTPNPVDGSVSETIAVLTGEQAKLACINTYPVHIGNLEISKTVRNDSALANVPDDIFTFQLDFQLKGTNQVFPATLTKADGSTSSVTLSGTESNGNMTLTFQLKNGETVRIEKLPEGECTVTEINLPVNYTVEYPEAKNTVHIAPNQTQVFAVTNAYNPPTLTIRKTNAEDGQVFVYEVRRLDANGNEGEPITVTVTGNSETTIHGLVPGTYTVTQKNLWSWRYGKDDEKKSVSLTAEDATVIFDGRMKQNSWLDGNSILVKNQKTGG